MPTATIKFIPANRAGLIVDPAKYGIIEVRPGVKGLNLGEKKYAGAYIRVMDEHHYVSGMCLYSDHLPEGYDVIKYCLDPKDCLKALKDDRDYYPNMPDKMNKGIMTKYRDNVNWTKWGDQLLNYRYIHAINKQK